MWSTYLHQQVFEAGHEQTVGLVQRVDVEEVVLVERVEHRFDGEPGQASGRVRQRGRRVQQDDHVFGTSDRLDEPRIRSKFVRLLAQKIVRRSFDRCSRKKQNVTNYYT